MRISVTASSAKLSPHHTQTQQHLKPIHEVNSNKSISSEMLLMKNTEKQWQRLQQQFETVISTLIPFFNVFFLEMVRSCSDDSCI